MTDEQKREAALRLLTLNKTVRALADTIQDAAYLSDEADQKGLAFACHMLRESLLSYCRAVNLYAREVLEDGVDT